MMVRSFCILLFIAFLSGCTKHEDSSISGTVTLAGACPMNAACTSSVDGACKHDGVTLQHWIVNNGHVANALIWIKDGLGNTVYPAPEEALTLDQRGCVYEPHVIGLMAGQTLKILNSDPTLHNVHLISATPSEDFNKLFLQGMPAMEEKFQTVGIREIKCDVHNWMNCYVGVFSNPFFAVSDSNGHYEIDGLPSGKYTLELWHESSDGLNNPIIQDEQVSIGEKEKKSADFTISAR